LKTDGNKLKVKFYYKPNFDSPFLFTLISACCAEKQIQTPLEAMKIGQLDQTEAGFMQKRERKRAKITVNLPCWDVVIR